VRLSDVARVELGSKDYEFIGRINGKSATLVGIFLSPGANALDVAKTVKTEVAELATRFPKVSPIRSRTTRRASSRCRSVKS
jgi:multidrug efflux pump subunit AcrB